MGGGSVCLLETVARAGSLAGTYAWSVWLLSPAGHLWAGCSAQLAGWLIAAAFRRKVVRSKTISPAKRFRANCSGRMKFLLLCIMEAVSFCAQISLSHGPDIGSGTEPPAPPLFGKKKSLCHISSLKKMFMLFHAQALLQTKIIPAQPA